MLRGGAGRRLVIGFELKHFSPEALAKLAALNPHLASELGFGGQSREEIEKEFLQAEKELNESWVQLEAAYKANTEATEALLKKGPPLVTPVQILGALIFLIILIKIIEGG